MATCMEKNAANGFVLNIMNLIRGNEHSDELSLSVLLKRDFLYFAYRQQKVAGEVDYNRLLEQVGTANKSVMGMIYEDMRTDNAIDGPTKPGSKFKLCENLLNAIGDDKNGHFYGPKSYYKLDQPLGSFSKSETLLDTINSNVAPTNLTWDVGNHVADLFSLRTPEVRENGFVTFKNSDGNSILNFYIYAYPKTVDSKAFGEVAVSLLEISDDVTPVALVMPSIDEKGADIINSKKNMFVLWDLSLIALLHQVNAMPRDQRIKVGQRLNDLFAHTENTDSRYSEGQMMRKFREIASE